MSADRKGVSTWLAFMVALALAVPQPPSILSLAAGGVIGAVLIVSGFAAARRCRVITGRPPGRRLAYGAASAVAGAILGAALVTVLVVLARVEPALRARFLHRAGEPLWRPLALAFESSVLEEIAFRLFALSAVAWIVGRALGRRPAAFAVALGVSTLLFALAHLPAWLSLSAPSAGLITGVLALNGAGGVLFGWVFWRWGLPYAILCHAAGDLVTQTLGPRLIG